MSFKFPKFFKRQTEQQEQPFDFRKFRNEVDNAFVKAGQKFMMDVYAKEMQNAVFNKPLKDKLDEKIKKLIHSDTPLTLTSIIGKYFSRLGHINDSWQLICAFFAENPSTITNEAYMDLIKRLADHPMFNNIAQKYNIQKDESVLWMPSDAQNIIKKWYEAGFKLDLYKQNLNPENNGIISQLQNNYRELTDQLALMLNKAAQKYFKVHEKSGLMECNIPVDRIKWVIDNVFPGAPLVTIMQGLQIAHKSGLIADFAPGANNDNMTFGRMNSLWYTGMNGIENLLNILSNNESYASEWEGEVSDDIKKRKIHDEIANINKYEAEPREFRNANKLKLLRIACMLDKMGMYKEADEITNELMLS
jgi:hypothetical protein